MAGMAQPTHKMTRGQKAALAAIAAGTGSFHRLVGERLEALGLAFRIAGLQNFLSNCNSMAAWGWALTEAGAASLCRVKPQTSAPAPKLDKSALLKDAHLRYRQGQQLNMGWSFAQCLSTAWAAAHQRQRAAPAIRTADKRRPHPRDFIFVSSPALAA